MNNRKYEPKCEMFRGRFVEGGLYEEMSKEFGVEMTADKVWYKLNSDTYLNLEYRADKINLDIYDYSDFKHITVEYIEEMKQSYKEYLEECEELKEVGFIPVSFNEYSGL